MNIKVNCYRKRKIIKKGNLNIVEEKLTILTSNSKKP